MQPSEPMHAAFLPWPQTYAMYLRYSAIQLNRYWSSTTLPIGSFCCAASPRSLLSEQVVELRPHRQRAQFPRTSSGSLRKHLEGPPRPYPLDNVARPDFLLVHIQDQWDPENYRQWWRRSPSAMMMSIRVYFLFGSPDRQRLSGSRHVLPQTKEL